MRVEITTPAAFLLNASEVGGITASIVLVRPPGVWVEHFNFWASGLARSSSILMRTQPSFPPGTAIAVLLWRDPAGTNKFVTESCVGPPRDTSLRTSACDNIAAGWRSASQVVAFSSSRRIIKSAISGSCDAAPGGLGKAKGRIGGGRRRRVRNRLAATPPSLRQSRSVARMVGQLALRQDEVFVETQVAIPIWPVVA